MLRRSPLALVTIVLITASMLGGIANATTSTRKFSVAMPTCVKNNTTTTLTATITNSASSSATQKIGSIFLDSPEANFGGITPASAFQLSRSDWTGKLESAFGTSSSRFDLDGLYLVANTTGASLAPGASITVTFPVTVKAPQGLIPWSPYAWTATTPNTGSSFSLTSAVKINVSSTCSGPLDHFKVEATTPQTAGGSFPVKITAQDSSNNTVASYTGSKSIVFSGPGAAPDNTQPLYPTSVSFTNGVATSAFVTLYKAESTTLTAKDGTTTGSAPVVVNADTARLVFAAQPGGATAGAPFANQPVVKTQDQYGNDSLNGIPANLNVTMSVTGTGTLSGTVTKDIGTTAGNGTVTYTDLQLDKTGSKTLTATAASNPPAPATSDPFTVGAGGANSFLVEAPATATAGTAFDVTITAQDGSGNTVDSYTGSKSVTFSGPADSPSNEGPDYPATVTFNNGVGTASVTLKKAETTQLTATEGSLTGTSGDISVDAGDAASIAFKTQPTNTLLGSKINAPDGVTVEVTDGFGNPVSGVTPEMIISPDSFASGLIVGGTMAPATDLSGQTTFSDLEITPTSSGYEIQAQLGSVLSANSDTFAITNTSPDNCGSSTCTASFGPGLGSVSAPPGTTLIIENNDVVTCPTLTNAVAGTVTVIPPSGPGTTEITFDDPYSTISPILVGKTYPVCKGTTGHPTGEILQPCASHAVPCVKSQGIQPGPLNLVTVIEITSTDPPVRH